MWTFIFGKFNMKLTSEYLLLKLLHILYQTSQKRCLANLSICRYSFELEKRTQQLCFLVTLFEKNICLLALRLD